MTKRNTTTVVADAFVESPYAVHMFVYCTELCSLGVHAKKIGVSGVLGLGFACCQIRPHAKLHGGTELNAAMVAAQIRFWSLYFLLGLLFSVRSSRR